MSNNNITINPNAAGTAVLTGAAGGSWSYSMDLNDDYSNMIHPSVNFGIVKAHGGTIVVCKYGLGSASEYYIIPDKVKNFDRELGKIISMHLLKSKN